MRKLAICVFLLLNAVIFAQPDTLELLDTFEFGSTELGKVFLSEDNQIFWIREDPGVYVFNIIGDEIVYDRRIFTYSYFSGIVFWKNQILFFKNSEAFIATDFDFNLLREINYSGRMRSTKCGIINDTLVVGAGYVWRITGESTDSTLKTVRQTFDNWKYPNLYKATIHYDFSTEEYEEDHYEGSFSKKSINDTTSFREIGVGSIYWGYGSGAYVSYGLKSDFIIIAGTACVAVNKRYPDYEWEDLGGNNNRFLANITMGGRLGEYGSHRVDYFNGLYKYDSYVIESVRTTYDMTRIEPIHADQGLGDVIRLTHYFPYEFLSVITIESESSFPSNFHNGVYGAMNDSTILVLANKLPGMQSTLMLYKYDESLFSVNDSSSLIIPDDFNINTYPNPFNSTINISGAVEACYAVYDIYGNMVSNIGNGYTQNAVWQPSQEIVSGVYIIKASTRDGANITKPVIYVK